MFGAIHAYITLFMQQDKLEYFKGNSTDRGNTFIIVGVTIFGQNFGRMLE